MDFLNVGCKHYIVSFCGFHKGSTLLYPVWPYPIRVWAVLGLIGLIVVLAHFQHLPGHIAQPVMCLTADTCLTADPGVARSIPAWSHTFVEIDNEKILRPFSSFQLIQEGLLSVTNESMCTKYWFTA